MEDKLNYIGKNMPKFLVWFMFGIFALALCVRFYNDYNNDFSRVNRALKSYQAGKIDKESYNFICDDCNYPTWKVK
jgi:hypothetical protein